MHNSFLGIHFLFFISPQMNPPFFSPQTLQIPDKHLLNSRPTKRKLKSFPPFPSPPDFLFLNLAHPRKAHPLRNLYFLQGVKAGGGNDAQLVACLVTDFLWSMDFGIASCVRRRAGEQFLAHARGLVGPRWTSFDAVSSRGVKGAGREG